MSTPDPRTPLPPLAPLPALTPSGSTSATFIAGTIVSVCIWALSLKGITMPAGLEAQVAIAIASIAGYIPTSGRRVNTL